ncbi:MAG: glycosyltransferase family 9 protein [Gammaproteobacteria bacterium]|nr:glycosyltransferase family 9 protein [Gammaproteobacteria bacterium]
MSIKILAVRVGRVGDTVMMTPALTALLQYYPGAEITLLVSPVGKLLLNDFHPNIKNIWTWNRSGLIRPALDKRDILNNLTTTHFDKIICFDTSPRIASLFAGINTEFHQYKGSSVLKHCAKAYLDFLAEACKKPVIDTYNYLPIKEDARIQVEQELKTYGIHSDDTLLMIHPTFSGYSRFGIRKRKAKLRKLWAPENYGNLITQIAKININNKPVKPFMVLLPDELSYGERIQKHSNNKLLLLKSESTFERYKAMIQRADVLLTPDSGPMHMASALGTKIVAFFSMKDPGDCGPYMPPSEFIILRSENFAHPEKGINAIDVGTVYEACHKLLSVN